MQGGEKKSPEDRHGGTQQIGPAFRFSKAGCAEEERDPEEGSGELCPVFTKREELNQDSSKDVGPYPPVLRNQPENRVFADDQGVMRSFKWALIQCDWCPYKKGTRGHRQTYRENVTGP